MRLKPAFVFALSGLIAAGSAVAAEDTPNAGTPRAPDQTLGAAIMSGFVAPNGTLIRGSGVTASMRSALSLYVVTFSRSIAGCYFHATVAAAADNSIDLGFANAGPYTVSGANNRLLVTTSNENGGPADKSFVVTVICAR